MPKLVQYFERYHDASELGPLIDDFVFDNIKSPKKFINFLGQLDPKFHKEIIESNKSIFSSYAMKNSGEKGKQDFLKIISEFEHQNIGIIPNKCLSGKVGAIIKSPLL